MVLGLGSRPNIFRRIVLGSVGGKTMCGKPVFVCFDPFADDFCPMRRQSVYEQDKMSTALIAFQFFEIVDEMVRSDCLLLHSKYQPRTRTVGLTDDRAQDSPMLPSSGRAYVRRMPPLSPRIPDYRTIGESCFVMETKGCFGSEPLFLSVGPTSLYQRRMPASFLSLARRTGFWFVQPVDRRIFQTWPG